MSENVEAAPPKLKAWRDRLAAALGVPPERKEEIYLQLLKSATLRDSAYWLQLVFAAGIATLGLVLNSPAVIIGAMLISPLMGPILAGGLAFATGDMILGLRAVVSLGLSCVVAIGFSVLLVGLLPFKEMTAEITARTQPNTLDLAVALFSGAVGSVAICKEVKGVVTSIPGVAIAVALMPPLCVVGYGFGIAISQSGAEGMRVARGGGLLFLTNLVAITFTAMLVFVALHLDGEQVKERVREWRAEDRESVLARFVLMRLGVSEKLRSIGGLSSRLVMILIALVLLMIPLTQSLRQLRQQIRQQREENRVQQAARELWQQQFEKAASGESRSFLDTLSTTQTGGKLGLTLRVFDAQPYTETEKTRYARLVAERLGRPADSIALQLIEIPTAAALLAAREKPAEHTVVPPTAAQLLANFRQGAEFSLRGLSIPPPAQLLGYRFITAANVPTTVEIIYLSERDIEPDAEALITQDARARLTDTTAGIKFERAPASFGPANFNRQQATLPEAFTGQLDRAGQLLQQYPQLRAEVTTSQDGKEREGLAAERAKAVSDFLTAKWQVAAERMTATQSAKPGRSVDLRIELAGK